MSRRVVDCTKVLQHGQTPAFVSREFERAGRPGALDHRVEMDATAGTHVLAPRHFVRWGSAIADLPVESFFGEGVVAQIEVTDDAPDIDSNRLEDALGRRLQNHDVVVVAARGRGAAPCFTAQAAQWLFVRGAKLVALADGVVVGRAAEPDDERVILSTLLETNVPVVRGLVNTDALSSERMAFMAVPAAAAGVTAWPVRFVALDPGPPPEAGAAPAPETAPAAAAAPQGAAAPEQSSPAAAADNADAAPAEAPSDAEDGAAPDGSADAPAETPSPGERPEAPPDRPAG